MTSWTESKVNGMQIDDEENLLKLIKHGTSEGHHPDMTSKGYHPDMTSKAYHPNMLSIFQDQISAHPTKDPYYSKDSSALDIKHDVPDYSELFQVD